MASNSQVRILSSGIPLSSRVMKEGALEQSLKTKEDLVVISTLKPVADITKGDTEPPSSKKPALDQRYNEFLKMVTEIGKDVKPAYTNSKSHGDRLKRNITTARSILRECLGELDRLSRQDITSSSISTSVVKSNSPSIKH